MVIVVSIGVVIIVMLIVKKYLLVFVDIVNDIVIVTSWLSFLITLWPLLLWLVIIWCRVRHNRMLSPITRVEMSGFLQIHLLLFHYTLRFPLIILTEIHQPLNKCPDLILILLRIYPTIVLYLIIPHSQQNTLCL